MNNTRIKTVAVDSNAVDFEKKYHLVALLRHFHETVDEHATEMGMDATTVWEKYAAIWILTRIRVEIDRLPDWHDTVTVETYPIAPGIVRMEREAVFSDAGGEFARLSSEWCLLDKASGRPRRPSLTGYPEGVAWRSGRVTAPYSRFDPAFAPDDAVFSHTVRVSDLDMNVHMNNVAYVRLASDVFSADFYRMHRLTSFEIAFKNQCFEGETIGISRKEENGRYFVSGVKADGTRVFDTAFAFAERSNGVPVG